jgi:hypothetical protein
MNTSEATPKRVLPDWAGDLFTAFLDHQEELVRILHLSMSGIAMLRGRHQALKVLAEIDGRVQDSEKKLEQAAKEKDLAQREVENDFPLLHEQATVALWSSLEAMVRTFAARWLQNDPTAWQADAVRKLKVRLGEYEALSQQDRCLWIVDLIDQEAGGALRNGVNRFETLLQPFQLDGPLTAEIQKTLFELSQIRHVIVHRRAEADRRLLETCPWLSLKAGERLKVTHDMWHRYNGAVAEYVLEVIQRVRVKLGVGRYEPEDKEKAPSERA